MFLQSWFLADCTALLSLDIHSCCKMAELAFTDQPTDDFTINRRSWARHAVLFSKDTALPQRWKYNKSTGFATGAALHTRSLENTNVGSALHRPRQHVTILHRGWIRVSNDFNKAAFQSNTKLKNKFKLASSPSWQPWWYGHDLHESLVQCTIRLDGATYN